MNNQKEALADSGATPWNSPGGFDSRDVLAIIKKRRSIRKYKDLPVEWDKLVNVLTAAQHAPSAGNLQDWKFIVVTDDERRKKIAKACVNQVWMETAPVHIVICSIPERPVQYYGKIGEKYTLEDCSAAAMSIMIQATAEDLSTCWVGAFDEMLMRLALGIPDRATPVIVLTVGYADEDVPIPPKMVLESQVYLQRYGNRYRNLDAILWDYSLQYEKLGKQVTKNLKQEGKRIFSIIKEKFKKSKEKMSQEKNGKNDA